MPLTRVQLQSNQSAANVASLSGTYSPAPTQGNLLVAVANSDATVTMTSTGWTQAISSVNDTGLYQWYKIAGASESATVTVTPSSAASTEIVIEEWNGNTATPLDKTSSGSLVTGSTCPSGTTATLAQADEEGIAAFGWNSANTADSYTNSYVEVAEIIGLGTLATRLAVTELALASTAATTTTMTLSGSTANAKSGLIATYRAAAVAAVPVPDIVMSPAIPT